MNIMYTYSFIYICLYLFTYICILIQGAASTEQKKGLAAFETARDYASLHTYAHLHIRSHTYI